MSREFWKSSGLHLLDKNERGWLAITPDFMRAYLLRPEMRPVEESCAVELALHDELMDDPFREVAKERLGRFADSDAADNYRAVLALRGLLRKAGTVEGAYLAQVRAPDAAVPPLFMDQLAHLIVHNIAGGCDDPMRLRAAELFFREQSVSLDTGRVLLADQEIVQMHAEAARPSGIGQLMADRGVRKKTVELDVLDQDNKAIYWTRSDRFDTVVDFRLGKPVVDAFARMVEAWIAHLFSLAVRVEPRERIDSTDWRWHIGLDREASELLNALYAGKDLSFDEVSRFIGLFRMTFADPRVLTERVRGSPLFLGLAMSAAKRVRMKPQNLVANLPLAPAS